VVARILVQMECLIRKRSNLWATSTAALIREVSNGHSMLNNLVLSVRELCGRA
jgi:hypothetical protein